VSVLSPFVGCRVRAAGRQIGPEVAGNRPVWPCAAGIPLIGKGFAPRVDFSAGGGYVDVIQEKLAGLDKCLA
jgi:hypothetical protein